MTLSKMTLIVCALAICLSNSTLAQQNEPSADISVRTMYEDCKGRNLDFCDGFLFGIARGLETLRTYNPKFAEEYCPPSTTDPAAYRAIFIDWADRSEFWRANSYDGAVVALWIAWFCPSTG